MLEVNSILLILPHFLYHACHACVLSHVWLFAVKNPMQWNPMDCSPPGSSVHGISQARLLGWVAISFFREWLPFPSSWPRNQTQVSLIASRFFTIWATKEAIFLIKFFWYRDHLILYQCILSGIWDSEMFQEMLDTRFLESALSNNSFIHRVLTLKVTASQTHWGNKLESTGGNKRTSKKWTSILRSLQ